MQALRPAMGRAWRCRRLRHLFGDPAGGRSAGLMGAHPYAVEPLMRFMVGASSAEIVAAILRVLFPEARAALDLTPGHRAFWSESVPTNVSVHFSPHDFTALPC